LKTVYPNTSGIPDKKTSKLFRNAFDNKLDKSIPSVISNILAEAYENWFNNLRKIRIQVTHFDTGYCTKIKNKISYIHPGLGTELRAFVSEDIFSDLDILNNQITLLLNTVFIELLKTLSHTRGRQICCIFNGRFYERDVSAWEAIDFHGGICRSYKWFEKNGSPTCPFASNCGAYLATLYCS